MGATRVGRIVVISCAVVVMIGAGVVLTSVIQARTRSDHPSVAAVAQSATVRSSTTSPRRSPATLSPSVGIHVTVPALTEASPTEPLATFSPSKAPRASSAPAAPKRPAWTVNPSAGPTTTARPAPAPSPIPGRTAPPNTAAPTTAPSSVPSPATSRTADVSAQYAHPLGWVGGGKMVSLTFDDGPSQYTGQVLDLLARYGVRATFCQIGQQVGQYPAVEARIRAAGHTFCDHTWDHDEALPAKSVAVIDSEISRTQQAIKALTGVTPRYYRAPGGDWGRTNKLHLELARFHTVPLAWADDSLDWTKPGVAAIVHTVLSTVSPGAIILMHDGGGNRAQTIAALPKIITGLRAAGYHFVVLPPNPTS